MPTPFEYSLTLFDDAHDPKYGEPYQIPLLIANENNVKPYGKFVDDIDKEQIAIEPWPMQGWRKLCPGTGTGGGITEGYFKLYWDGDLLKGINESCPQDGEVGVGRLPKGVSTTNRSHIIARELNYHPDGEQIFYPRLKTPFVALVAKPGDDLKLEDVVALYFDGSCGFKLWTNVWHQAVMPLGEEARFAGKQGKVHGCVMFDSVKEYGKILVVPLKPELAEK